MCLVKYWNWKWAGNGAVQVNIKIRGQNDYVYVGTLLLKNNAIISVAGFCN